MSEDALQRPAVEQARMVRSGEVSARELVQDVFVRAWEKLSLFRGPGGLQAKRKLAGGKESTWVVVGASRGEAGILGEGIRQALLRDPAYRRALDCANAMLR